MIFYLMVKKEKIKIKRLDRFLISYNGNKYQETKKYLLPLFKNVHKYDIIAEPYCGIFGFSRAFFETYNDFQGEIWLNDYDEELIKILEQIKKIEKVEDLKQIEEKLNSYERNEDLTQDSGKNKLLDMITRGINERLKCLHKGKQKIKNYKEKLTEYKSFFDHVKFFNMEALDFIKMVNNTNKKSLIFYDPPYFNSHNKSYCKFNNEEDEKIYFDGTTSYLNIFKDFDNKDNQNTLFFIMNKIDIINYIFQKFKIGEIKGKYGGTQLRTKSDTFKSIKWHIIYAKNHE